MGRYMILISQAMKLYTLLGAILLGKIACSPSCYRTKSGECREHLSQGDCGDGEWLVPGEGGVLECQERDCHPRQVLIDGRCLDINGPSVCTGAGEEISVNAMGEVSCQCEDGWSRNKIYDIPSVSQGDCVQDITYADFEYDEDNAVVSRVPRDDYPAADTCTGKCCCTKYERCIPDPKKCPKKKNGMKCEHMKCVPCKQISKRFSRNGRIVKVTVTVQVECNKGQQG